MTEACFRHFKTRATARASTSSTGRAPGARTACTAPTRSTSPRPAASSAPSAGRTTGGRARCPAATRPKHAFLPPTERHNVAAVLCGHSTLKCVEKVCTRFSRAATTNTTELSGRRCALDRRALDLHGLRAVAPDLAAALRRPPAARKGPVRVRFQQQQQTKMLAHMCSRTMKSEHRAAVPSPKMGLQTWERRQLCWKTVKNAPPPGPARVQEGVVRQQVLGVRPRAVGPHHVMGGAGVATCSLRPGLEHKPEAHRGGTGGGWVVVVGQMLPRSERPQAAVRQWAKCTLPIVAAAENPCLSVDVYQFLWC